MLIATLVAVVMLPLIYGGLYLWAFWDPYGKLDNLPVAIVNEDRCAFKQDKKDKTKYCFGQDLVDELNTDKKMNWQFVDRETANNGLKNKKYYTMAIIPGNFSENVLSVDTDNPQQAKIEFKSRQASSFMAAKFSDTAFAKIKSTLNEKISKEYFDNIFSETRDSIKDLQKAVDGSSDLVDGLIAAKKGSDDLYDGIDKANSGAVDLKSGLNTLHDGGEKLANGSDAAYNGTISLINGATNLNVGISNLVSGSSQMTSSIDSLSNYQAIVVQSINAYLVANPSASSSAELQTALTMAIGVNNGLGQLKTGLMASNQGVNQIYIGSNNLKNGLTSLSVGVSDLATGSASLRNGLASAVDGDQTLITGLEKIKSGENDLGSGLTDAIDGAKELRDKLKESVDKNIKNTNENKNKTQAQVMSVPVDIHDISIDIVNNNGTGFVPYFVPLALWVGGMAIFFLVDLNMNKKKIWKQFMPKFWVSLMVSIIQVLTLDLVLVKLLGLKVNMLWQFVAFGILLGGCFAIIQMFLTLAFGLSGKFIGIVLLMLQLTSSAGSYPIETAPLFFQKIGPYLPMTYAVSALRELVSGSNKEIVIYDVKIIFVFTLVFIFALIFDLFKKNGLSSIKSLWIKKIK